MKNKPTKHKETNTFRFLPFADRIAAIDVDVFHQIDRRRGVEEEGEKQTFFFLALEKWSVLNCTESYTDFRRRLVSPEDVETLPQLLLQTKEITKTLLKDLTSSNYHSLQPVLECVVALAKDLRNDFYPYFPAFLIRIVNILAEPVPSEGRGQKEAEIAEWCLSCLAHLCKILWRSMLKDWNYVYGSLLLPLILTRVTKARKSADVTEDGERKKANLTPTPASDDSNEEQMEVDEGFQEKDEYEDGNSFWDGSSSVRGETDSKAMKNAGKDKEEGKEKYSARLFTKPLPEYVKDFVVQSFAFVARKTKDRSGFLESVLLALKENESGIQGTGQLLAEVMKGVQGNFHSCAETFLPTLLHIGCTHSEEISKEYIESTKDSVEEDERSIAFQLVKQILAAVMSNIKPERNASLLWKCLLDTVKQYASKFRGNPGGKEQIRLLRSLKLLHSAINLNFGKWLSSDVGQYQGLIPAPQMKSSMPLANSLTNVIVSILELPNISKNIALEVGGVAGSILSSQSVREGRLRLDQVVAAKLTNQVLQVSDTAVIINFVQRTTNFSGFEALVLPHLMAFCCKNCSNISAGTDDLSGKDILHLLACLILNKAPPCLAGGSALKHWNQYNLDFNRSRSNVVEKDVDNFHSVLKDVLCIPSCRKFDEFHIYLSALIIIPHMKKFEGQGKLLADSLNALLDLLASQQYQNKIKEEDLLFMISEALIAAVLTKDDGGRISRHVSVDTVLNLLLKHSTIACRIPVLRAIDVLITATVSEESYGGDKLSLLNQLYDMLSGNLASPHREVCRLTLHMLSVVEKALKPEGNVGLFSICLNAEEIPLTIHEFREKLGILESLKPVLNEPNNETILPKASLQYLLGIHLINFQLLWEPMYKIIASHACANPPFFWDVFIKQFRLSTDFVKVDAGCELDSSDKQHVRLMVKKFEINQKGFLSNCDFLHEWYSRRFKLPDTPDFINYRIQLINTMCVIPEICEAKNRDVSELFLSFYREEFVKSDTKLAPTWDIRKTEEASTAEDDEDFELKLVDEAPSGKFSVRLSTKALVAYLSLMSKMRNPKAMHKEPDLAKVYNELISHRNPDIQKHALDCLLAYRCKKLSPYRENLYNLIDEKRFKSELSLFRIDKESEIIKEEDRSNLIPLVMQILYSKMLSSNKRMGHARRSLVLRFIAGCHDAEIVIFLRMAFRLLNLYMNDKSSDLTIMVRDVMSSIKLDEAIHPKRLLSTANLLLVVIERLGNLLLHSNNASSPSEALQFLLQCIICTNALIAGEYAKKAFIHPGHVASLRTARASALGTVSTFFSRLDRYPWSSSLSEDGVFSGDLEAVFESCVWPWLDQLPIEGIHSPTALLRLFIVWSENPRYYPLLAKKNLNSDTQYSSVMPAIISLLVGNKTKPSVVNAILDMIERLLTYASKEESGVPMEVQEELDSLPELPPLDVGPIVELQTERIDNLLLTHKLNFGSSIILPHVPSIIGVLYKRFCSLKKGSSPSARDLRVLSRISELIWEPRESKSLIQLILPIAIRKASLGSTGEQMCQLLQTTNNLLRNIPYPSQFLRLIAPLFSMVEGHNARTILCHILETVADKKEKCTNSKIDTVDGFEDEIDKMIYEEDLKLLSKTIGNLNSWDPSRIEEPDYARRLDTYKKIKVMREDVASGGIQFPLMLGIILIHNSFHVIKCEKDMSLRENAGHCLKTLAPLLANSVAQNKLCRNLVVGDTLLNLITKALKDRKASDSLLYDSIGTLAALVHECPGLHPVLKDLSRLACKLDPEVDFFENIRHLQLHRRGRALSRFVQDAKEAEKPMGPQTLTCIILPLAFYYLFNTRYAKNNSLVDSAIEAVGAACHCLPWHHYEAILKHQLARLHRETTEFGRQPIRLIVAILNNFHFNLSRADKDQEQKVSPENCKIELEQVEEQPSQIAEEGEEEEPEEVIGVESVEEEESNDADEEISVKAVEPAWLQDLLLPASAARRARKSLSVILLPKLHASLIEPTERDSSHKLNRKAGGAVGAEIPSQKPDSAQKDEEETLVMRVPIALAAVKMLQRLPTDFMEENLSGILLKVMAFLKCRLESVRRAARETLVEISVSLGPKYLPVVVREMSSLLLSTRGYAFHVLAFTAHSLLVALVSLMQPGDINKCLKDFLEICKADLFGLSAEEKEVNRITAKVYEAKSHKSYDSFQLLAKVVPESCLIDLIQPLKEVLDSTHSYKSVKIVKECLIRVVKGLSDNSFVSSTALLTFSYGVLSQNISSLWPATAKETEKPLPRRTAGAYAGVNGTVSKPLAVPADSYLIPKEPRKVRSKVTGAVDKVGAQANAHTMTEFGLQLLHSLLKKEQIRWRKDVGIKDSFIVTDMDAGKQSDEVVVDIMMLDPLLPVVCKSLESQHAKIATLALNCFRMMLRMDLPSLDDHLVKAAQAVYTILHKYAGATSGDNYNLAVAAFKAVAVLVRFVKSLPVEEDHLSALLTYVSRDLDLGGEVGSSSSYSGPARTATAFGVLRSILARKLRSPLIPPLMKRVAKLSIIAEASHIQTQSRQVFLQFLLDYPMSKKKLDNNVSFYLGQLDYELLSGRESALEFIQSIISVFPPLVLKNCSGTIFVSLAARLLEEEIPSCRKQVADIIKSMLLRLNKATRDTLFNILMIWMKDSELTHQQVGFQVCGIFVLTEGAAFSSRLSDVLPIIVEQLRGKDKANDVSCDTVNLKPQMGISNEKRKKKLSRNCEEDFVPGKYVRAPPPDDDEEDNHCPGKYVRISHSIEAEDSMYPEDSLGEDLEENTEDTEMDHENDGSAEDCDKVSESGIDMECEEDKSRDHQLFQMLQLVLKIMMSCPEIFSTSKWRTYVNEIAVCCQLLLAYPHEWVRLASSQVLGSIFGSVEASNVALALKKEKLKKKDNSLENNNCLPFLFTGVKRRLKSLILDLTGQLECNSIGPQLADQVVKNLVFLAKVLKFLEVEKKVNEENVKEDESKLSLAWMMFKMRKIVNKEVTLTPNQTILRSAVFKWLAVVALELSSEPELLKLHIHQILGPIIREMEDKNKSEETRSKDMKELRRLAYEVSELVKEKVGMEEYSEAVRDIQAKLNIRRTERKRKRAQEVVSMPEVAAKRKIKKQLVKKKLKRKKISIMKGRRLGTK